MNTDIQFFTEEHTFELTDHDNYRDWLVRIAFKHHVEISNLNYIFCSDDYLLKINQDHLNHDTYTDIITFPLGLKGEISGDIFISIDRVQDNAEQYDEVFENELRRVMSHGLLHLIGFNDKTEAESLVMKSQEDHAILLFNNPG